MTQAATREDAEQLDQPIARRMTDDRIPIKEKLAYSFGVLPLTLSAHVVEYNSNNILVFGLGMSPALLAAGMTIFRVWDGFADPIMGWISDNTRSRWGRRRPYMLVAGLFVCLLLPFVYRFQSDWSHETILAWYVTFGILTSTATTAFNIPYQTIKLEMTPDYDERTSINAWSSIIAKLISFGGPWVWWMTQQPFFTGQAPGEEPNTLLGMQGLSLFFAFALAPFSILPGLFCKERYYQKAKQEKAEPFFRSLKMTFQNKPFQYMIAFILVMNVEGLVAGMGGFLVLYHVMGGNQEAASIVMGAGGSVSSVLGIAAVFFFGWLSRRSSKEASLISVVVAGALMSLGVLLFYRPLSPEALELVKTEGVLAAIVAGHIAPLLATIPSAFVGVYLAGLWLVLPSMQADVVDHDELTTGQRREGSFSSVFSFLLKLSGTIFYGLNGVLVVLVGFDVKLGADQASHVFPTMIWCMAGLPVALGVGKLCLLSRYPLKKQRVLEIRAKLEARRGAIDMAAG